MSKIKVGLAEIQSAQKLLAPMLEKTPLQKNTWLSEKYGCEVYLKLENMQPIGAFKIRGATYRISKLTEAEKKKGVVAASAGNHAQGVAWGSAKFGVQATIVMPTNAPLTKVQNTKALGAKVVLVGETFEQAFAEAQRIEKETGAVLVHAYEDADVIAGQGTVGLEIMEQLPGVDAVIVSLGGGGLMTGVATAIKAMKPKVQLIACQASGARSLVESLNQKKIVQGGSAETFADGIKVKVVTETMLSLLSEVIDKAVHTDDEEIAAAVLTLMEKAKTVAEGAGALPLATLDLMHRQDPKQFHGKKVVLVLGGGNIDVNVLSRIIDRGLIRAGRRIRVNVFISDKPGTLNQLTQLIASKGGSILQVIHDRNAPSVGLLETEVELTVETKGPEHSAELVAAIKGQFHRLELLH
jgi:threonine dehydratase